MANRQIPPTMVIDRGQTQTDVNRTVLEIICRQADENTPVRLLDLPCGNLEFLSYVKTLFPAAEITGADIVKPEMQQGIAFVQMDFTREFTIPPEKKYDVITSISGVMMFGNTLAFIRNCIDHLETGGSFIITNDNAATIKDRLSFFFLSRYRLFNAVFEDKEHLTENISINKLCHLLRTNGVAVEEIRYTSLYKKDLLLLPFALLAWCTQFLYLKRLHTKILRSQIKMMYPFRHLFCRHYVIVGRKV